MTKGELQTIRNIIVRMKEANMGYARGGIGEQDHCTDDGSKSKGRAHVSRIYIDTWLVGPLECLLPESRDVSLAERMSRK